MKKIVFATTGSLGDVYPFLAVGQELARRGHQVHIATTRKHQVQVEQAGLAFAPMRPDPKATPDFEKRFMDPKKGAEFVFREYLSPAIEDSFHDLTDATKGADMLVSQSLALAASMVAEKEGLPWVSAVFQPFTLFSVWEPPCIPSLPFLPVRHRLAARFNAYIMNAAKQWTEAWIAPVWALRRTLGLVQGGHPIYEGQHSPTRVLAMFSPLIGTPQPDWPPQTRQTGCAFYTAPIPLPPGLSSFLQNGPPPVLFTLGASSSLDPGDFFEQSLRAAQALGKRALLITGREDMRMTLPNGAFCAAYVPYHQVLPHVSAIVHSGGIGTICLAIAAAKPQLLVPFAHDQADNARRAARVGVARMLAKRRYREPFISRALERLLKMSPTVLAQASQAIADEQGAILAANVIEEALCG